MKEVTRLGLYIWFLAVFLYGIWDSILILSQRTASGYTYYTPLAEFGLGGLLVTKGFVLFSILLLFPLCRPISYKYSDCIPGAVSGVIASAGLYITAHKMLLTLPSGLP